MGGKTAGCGAGEVGAGGAKGDLALWPLSGRWALQLQESPWAQQLWGPQTQPPVPGLGFPALSPILPGQPAQQETPGQKQAATAGETGSSPSQPLLRGPFGPHPLTFLQALWVTER